MHNISMTQALEIWSELERAYHGTNPYGKDVAEIYSFRLQPVAYHNDLVLEKERRASNSLAALCELFSLKRYCSITIDGMSVSEWNNSDPFQKALVKVIPNT